MAVSNFGKRLSSLALYLDFFSFIFLELSLVSLAKAGVSIVAIVHMGYLGWGSIAVGYIADSLILLGLCGTCYRPMLTGESYLER